MSTTTQLSTLNINILTTEQYNGIADKDENELYLLTDAGGFDSSLDSTSENAVQNKVITSALNGKQSTITGAATTIASSNLTASRALVSDTGGKVAISTVTSTELGYISGVTSNIQTQLNTLSSSIANTGGAVVSSIAPDVSKTTLLWVDLGDNAILKYSDGSQWLPVGSAWR